mmetsp:Transcript_45920/g.113953  ORF Transcript_45920/g.113953 Transcript_45920/m.113953 type:complete len:251 (+) Transcript_45920:493-1245(+)
MVEVHCLPSRRQPLNRFGFLYLGTTGLRSLGFDKGNSALSRSFESQKQLCWPVLDLSASPTSPSSHLKLRISRVASWCSPRMWKRCSWLARTTRGRSRSPRSSWSSSAGCVINLSKPQKMRTTMAVACSSGGRAGMARRRLASATPPGCSRQASPTRFASCVGRAQAWQGASRTAWAELAGVARRPSHHLPHFQPHRRNRRGPRWTWNLDSHPSWPMLLSLPRLICLRPPRPMRQPPPRPRSQASPRPRS